MKFTAEQIAAYLHGDIVGDAKAVVRTFAKIEEGQPEAISFWPIRSTSLTFTKLNPLSCS